MLTAVSPAVHRLPLTCRVGTLAFAVKWGGWVGKRTLACLKEAVPGGGAAQQKDPSLWEATSSQSRNIAAEVDHKGGWLGAFVCCSDPPSAPALLLPWGGWPAWTHTGPNSLSLWLGWPMRTLAGHGRQQSTHFPGSLPAGPPWASGHLDRSQPHWEQPAPPRPGYR